MVVNPCKRGTLFLRSQELAEAFAAEGKRNSRERLLLAAAVGVAKQTVEAGYEVAEISKYVCLSACLYVCLPVCLSLYMSARQSIGLSVCQNIYK